MNNPFLLLVRLFLLTVLLAACGGETTTNAGTFGGGEGDTAVSDTPSWTPRLNLSTNTADPSTSLTLVGTDFPPDQLVFIYLADPDATQSEAENSLFAQTTSDGLGVFTLDLILPTLWPLDTTAVPDSDHPLLVRAETPAMGTAAPPAEASFTLNYQDAFQSLADETAGFTLQLPANWDIGSAQVTPLGQLRLFGPPPLEPGNPRANLLLVADLAQLDALGAAEQLQCGGGCAEEIVLTAVEIGDTPAQQTVIGGEGLPALTWYFVEHAGRLIYFTYNDPATLISLLPLVNTLNLGEAIPLQPDPTPAPTATTEPMATPEPTATATPELVEEPTAEPVLEPTTTASVADGEARDEGPLETTVNFLLDMSRQEVTAATLDRLTAELRPTEESFTAVYALLDLDDEVITGIDAARLNVPEVVVRAVLTSSDSTQTGVRLFTLLLEEDGAWRIVQIGVGELEPAEEVEAPTPTPEADTEPGENGEGGTDG